MESHQPSLEELREMSDAPTLIFMLILFLCIPFCILFDDFDD